MGARGIGHIADLCAIALPTIGIVTRVAAVHTEEFGTIDDVATAKAELVEALPHSGAAVLNAGDPRVVAMAPRTDASVVTFGTGGEVRAEEVTLGDDLRPRFRIVSPWGSATGGAGRSGPAPGGQRVGGRGRRSGRGGGHGVHRHRPAVPGAVEMADGPVRPRPGGPASSTTRTTPTPPRWRRRSSPSPPSRRGAGPPCSDAWRSWATGRPRPRGVGALAARSGSA